MGDKIIKNFSHPVKTNLLLGTVKFQYLPAFIKINGTNKIKAQGLLNPSRFPVNLYKKNAMRFRLILSFCGQYYRDCVNIKKCDTW